MNNIFPTTGMNLGFSGELPKFGGSDPLHEMLDLFDARTKEQDNQVPSGNLQRIAKQNIGQPEVEKPKNVVFKDDMTAFQRASLAERRADRESRESNQDANRDLSKERISIADYKARNPNKRFISVKGGNIMAIDPTTGEAEDTGIATNTLSDADRLRIQNDYRGRDREDRQSAATELENTRQTNRVALQNDRQNEPDWGNAIQTYKPDGTPDAVVQINRRDGTTRRVGVDSIKPPTTTQPTQQRHALDNRIIEAINRNPEWARYINQETGIVAPVGAGSSWTGNPGLTAEERNKILEAIHGGGQQQPPAYTTPTSNALPPREQRVMNQVYTLPNGRKGKWNGTSFTAVQE